LEYWLGENMREVKANEQDAVLCPKSGFSKLKFSFEDITTTACAQGMIIGTYVSGPKPDGSIHGEGRRSVSNHGRRYAPQAEAWASENLAPALRFSLSRIGSATHQVHRAWQNSTAWPPPIRVEVTEQATLFNPNSRKWK